MNDIQKLHEGSCPECDGDVDLVRFEGTDKFLDMWNIDESVTLKVKWILSPPDPDWSRDYHTQLQEYQEKINAVGGVGAMSFKCQSCGKEFYVEKTAHDWVM